MRFHNCTFERFKMTAHNCNFGGSNIMFHSHNFRRTKITFHNYSFGRSKITAHNDYFRWSRIMAHNRSFGLSDWLLVQIYKFMSSIWTIHIHIFDLFKWMAPHHRNRLCPNVHMWAVQLEDDPKLHSINVFFDRPNGRLSKFTLV